MASSLEGQRTAAAGDLATAPGENIAKVGARPVSNPGPRLTAV
jgi:hypothetical protein